MDTSYEKVCPGCGKSTAISEKFCAGCGHQFRTVFHDSTSGGAVAAVAPPSGDLRSTPVALIAVTVFLVLLCVLVLLFANRNTQPATAPAAVVVTASPSLSAAELSNQIYSGQSPAAVRAVAGEPARITRNMVGGLNTEDWYYPRGGRTVQVHFNGSHVVDATSMF